MLAAISLPPLTADANRHTPGRQPSRQAGGRARTPRRSPASANRPASAAGRTASPPSSTASAANATPSSAARPANRRTQPARGRIRDTRPRRRRAHPARAAGHLARSPRRPSRPHPAARPARTPAAAHGSPRSARTAAAARRSSGSGPPPGHDAGSQTRTSSARARRAIRARELHPTAGRHVRIDRQRARPYDGHGRHRLGSLPATVAKRRRGGIPHVQQGTATILARPSGQAATSPNSTAGHPAKTIR